MVPKLLSRRFTLRTLLLLVAVCAVVIAAYRFQLPPDEVQQIHLGMTFDEIEAELGFPNAGGNGERWGENWNYSFTWGRIALTFGPN